LPSVPVMMSTRPSTPQYSAVPRPVRADEADGMGVVDHHQRAIFVGQVADRLQVGDHAVHGEHAVGGDQLEAHAGGVRGLQLRLEVGHVVVAVAVAPGLAQAHAVDDGGVVELVGDDRVLFGAEQGLEQAAVGVEAAAVQDGVLGAEETSEMLASSCLCTDCVPQMKRTDAMPKPSSARPSWAALTRRGSLASPR
jgi:hypothetical protein